MSVEGKGHCGGESLKGNGSGKRRNVFLDNENREWTDQMAKNEYIIDTKVKVI